MRFPTTGGVFHRDPKTGVLTPADQPLADPPIQPEPETPDPAPEPDPPHTPKKGR